MLKKNRKKGQKEFSDTDDSSEEDKKGSDDSDLMIIEQDDDKNRNDEDNLNDSDEDFDDEGIMADIPTENTYQSTATMPGANNLMESGENMPYVSNCTIEKDNVDTPKEEFLETWETPDFFEFDRVFKCPRSEFVYLLKGIGYEKSFNLVMSGDNSTRSYRLLNFRCSDLVHKKKVKSL